MGYHTFTKESDLEKLMADLGKDQVPDSTDACFSTFERNFHNEIMKGQRAYSTIVLDIKGLDLVQNFNTLFKNIQIEVIFSRMVSEYEEPVSSYQLQLTSHDKDRVHKDAMMVTLTLNFSEEITRKSRYHVYTPIIQFIRSYAPSSSYDYRYDAQSYPYHQKKQVSLYQAAMECEPTVEAVLEALDKNGCHHQYGMWCTLLDMTLPHFLLMDDPDIINKATKDMMSCRFYGTTLMTALKPYLQTEPAPVKRPVERPRKVKPEEA